MCGPQRQVCVAKTRLRPQIAATTLSVTPSARQKLQCSRLAEECRTQDLAYNEKTIAYSLPHQGLRAKASSRFTPDSYREHGQPVSENLLKQDFYACGPNQKWSGAITYLRTGKSWLYLAVIIHPESRAAIGWSMSSRMTAQLTCDAVKMPLWRRERSENVIVHIGHAVSMFGGLSGAAETA